jgi:hypothetical protein
MTACLLCIRTVGLAESKAKGKELGEPAHVATLDDDKFHFDLAGVFAKGAAK